VIIGFEADATFKEGVHFLLLERNRKIVFLFYFLKKLIIKKTNNLEAKLKNII